MTTPLYEVLKRASLFLENNGREPRVAELLLQHHLGLSRNEFFMKMREPVAADELEAFQKDLEQHADTGVPVQHLTGQEEFYGRTFCVNEHVLIPRPETEEVVQEAIRVARAMNEETGNPLQISDIGTGSGIIAITMALELPNSRVAAVDLSEAALKVAENNAKQLGADIDFRHGSYLAPFKKTKEKVDMVISNPPYIPFDEKPRLSQTVTDFDPEMALFAEENGLAAYEAIVREAVHVLNPGGAIVFEIGHDQGETVPQIIRSVFPDASVHTMKDINGKDRIVKMRLPEQQSN